MADSTFIENNTIKLSVPDPTYHDEGYVNPGSANVYPGMFLRINQYSGECYFAPTAGEKVAMPTIIAVENPQQGKTMRDYYSPGERIIFRNLVNGNIVLTKVTTLTGNLECGLVLCPETTASGNAGWLRNWNYSSWTTEPHPIAVSLEAETSPTLPRWTVVMILK